MYIVSPDNRPDWLLTPNAVAADLILLHMMTTVLLSNTYNRGIKLLGDNKPRVVLI